MYDAVAAEIREAEDAGVNENTPLKEMSAASDIGSIYSYAYWFAGDRLVFAEHPKDPAVDAVCRQKIAEPFADNKLQYFSLDDNRGRRWQFYMLAGRDGDRRVVILVNVTPFKLLSLRYIYLLLGALLLMLTVAWTGGNFLADRTIAPLIRTLENQKRFAADASHELRTPAGGAAVFAGTVGTAVSETAAGGGNERGSARYVDADRQSAGTGAGRTTGSRLSAGKLSI